MLHLSISSFLLILNTFPPSTSAIPHGHPNQNQHHENIYSRLTNHSALDFANLSPRQNDKPLLRVMPLGASITQGFGSTPEEGYRHLLRNYLRFKGYPVNMVGSISTGDFPDNQHEGHPSYIVSDVAALAKDAVNRRKPNLVTINLGTNDCTRADDLGGLSFVEGTYDRMKGMIDDIFASSEGVTILLSTLIPNAGESANNYVNVANVGYRRLVQEYANQGKKIALAEMNNGWITTSDLKAGDPTHPSNDGYIKLAAVWANTFAGIETKNWLVDAIDVGAGGGATCDTSPDTFRGGIVTQRGSGANDGNYKHSSVDEGKRISYYGLARSSLIGQFHFAQLVNAGGADLAADEFIRVLDPEQMNDGGNTMPRFSYFRNLGNGQFDVAPIAFHPNSECINRGVRFGDFNGDGLDDFICINLEGNVYVSLNLGTDPVKFGDIKMIREMNISQDRIRLGDIDGDGRVDLCWFPADEGNIHCVRNTGVGDNIGWQPMEGFGGDAPIFDAKGMPSIDGVRLLDINGDGRYDWVYVYPDGSTRIFINHRGLKVDGPGLKPFWIEAESAHVGFAGVIDDAKRILFGRVWGTGRNDYIRQMDVTGSPYQYEFFFNRNTGAGGTRLKGDGAYYCDMFGRGHDDYLWVWSGGEIELFENTLSPPTWNGHGKIYNTGKNRKWIQFADWDGDGKCDILNIDRNTGNVYMYRNTWSEGKDSPTFDDPKLVVDGGLCPQPYSPGLYDLAVRFGDLDADGRADYLCLDPDGRTRGWLNKASGLENKGQVKVSVGFDRANHRFADVNGDGFVDFIWVDKFTGNVETWINEGMIPAPSVGSSMTWREHRTNAWIEGKSRGQNIHFPKLSNSGRADYHWVAPELCDAQTYYNECQGESNGAGPDDANGVTDPHLPTPDNGGGGGGGGGGTDTPWPLLYVGSDSTTVHLDLETSALVYNILQANTCPIKTKRAESVTECILDTFSLLVSNLEFGSVVVALYMGSPVAAAPKSMTELPRWSDELQQAAFLSAVILGTAQLEQVVVDLSDAAVIYMTYAIMNIAIQKIWNAPSSFASFSIGRNGKMEASCPAQDELDCSHQLCNGGNDSICTGFFSPCSCQQGNKCPNKDSKTFTLVCEACGGADLFTGECKGTSDGTNQGCPCASDLPADPYVWDDVSQWNRAIQEYNDIINSADYMF